MPVRVGLESSRFPWLPQGPYPGRFVDGLQHDSWIVVAKHSTKFWPEIRPELFQAGRAGFEPAKPCTPNRQSSVFSKSVQNGLTKLWPEVFRCSTQLSYSLHCRRETGGIRTRDLRRLMHGLRTGSQSASALRQKSSENPRSSEVVAETPSLSNLTARQWTRSVVCLRLQPLH